MQIISLKERTTILYKTDAQITYPSATFYSSAVILGKFFASVIVFQYRGRSLYPTITGMQISLPAFDTWNEEKKRIQSRDTPIYPNNGEVWMYKVGVNIGNEVSKSNPHIRPCIILNHLAGGDLVLIAPLTSKKGKHPNKYYLKAYQAYGLPQESYVLINQIKTISKKRLIRRVTQRKGNTHHLIHFHIINIIKHLFIKKIIKPKNIAF